MLAALKRQWSMYDLQYVFIALVFFVDFSIIQLPTLIPRFILAGLLITSFFIPYIKRFTVPALPIFTWLTTFYACQFIPLDYRPDHIFVNLLPTLERILYGANLSEIISQHTHPVLDVLAWLPYGVIHFSFPFILSLLLFVYGPPGCLKIFGKAFGFMNLAGVLTQLLFPNASPWYEIIYGSAPADYSIPGEAGGLLRIDEILGLDLYGSTFGTSPLVFGAFPSLHSGCATIEMLFFAYLFPRMKPVAIFYVMWMWFSTMYLTHHYMIDLVGALFMLSSLLQSHKTFCLNIEHDPRDYYKLPMTSDEEEKNVVRAIRPEPLRVATAELFTTYKTEEEVVALPALSPGYWSSTSEPTSPITPHTPSSGSPRLQFNKP
ncbi:uncharacterized protein B0P05DRAFT_575781 [Gilbertella persicaria]|uniref:uncharacterized protein n=1 Tax=Gilbertella persicaria TaxID=101096 RepID=UPI00221F33FC|nr:uncharacterized protein B0P05DRAFT_575781 [Gilbertella persicaria]KAI8050125.1 hypothetical protein B0P05DRAFT_575781 [Gilbertella persicaria]